MTRNSAVQCSFRFSVCLPVRFGCSGYWTMIVLVCWMSKHQHFKCSCWLSAVLSANCFDDCFPFFSIFCSIELVRFSCGLEACRWSQDTIKLNMLYEMWCVVCVCGFPLNFYYRTPWSLIFRFHLILWLRNCQYKCRHFVEIRFAFIASFFSLSLSLCCLVVVVSNVVIINSILYFSLGAISCNSCFSVYYLL